MQTHRTVKKRTNFATISTSGPQEKDMKWVNFGGLEVKAQGQGHTMPS